MVSSRTSTHRVCVPIFLLLMLQSAALAQVSIQLDGVPDRLWFPLPEGANQILTATISGGEVKSAWLAVTDADPSLERVMLTKVEESKYAINLGAREVYDLLKTRRTGRQFRILAQAKDGTIVRSLTVGYRMNVVPERLDFPFDEAKITIYQRASKRLPGSGGAVRIHLGDITAGQVPVTIYGPSGALLVDTTPMRQGDTVSLPLAEQDYVLRLDRLVNLLVGHDYGVFTLMPLHRLEASRIDDLFRIIEKADATFVRNDEELSGEAFASHLRRKHEYYSPRNASLTDFIESVATRSSTSGKRYRVKLPSGDTVDASAWLRTQANHVATGTEKGKDALSVLLRDATASDRDIWWPAVVRLGELGRHDDDLRSQIWNQARVNSVGMKFVELPLGIFTMGPDTHRIHASQVAHKVKLSRGYFISVTEVTNAQFKQLFPDFEWDATYSPNPDSPAVNVTWNMADRFCRLLSEKERVDYRLPTEAEWEYTCRAGSTSLYCFGNDKSRLSDYAWCDESVDRASEVAMLKPNLWGLYDMHGNVFEWVADWHTRSYYSECAAKGVVTDPTGPPKGLSHVLRSGPWATGNHMACTSTARFPRPILDRVPFDPDPVKMSQLIGFRVVRKLDH